MITSNKVIDKNIDDLQVDPLSRNKITECSYLLRTLFGYENIPRFPIKHLEKYIIEYLDPLFYLAAETKEEMGIREGFTIPKKHRIYLREDVYEDLEKDDTRAAFTLAHEFGHYILHAKSTFDITMQKNVPIYYSSEWQANVFAADFLMPPHLLNKTMSPQDISVIFGVSLKAANKQHGRFCV